MAYGNSPPLPGDVWTYTPAGPVWTTPTADGSFGPLGETSALAATLPRQQVRNLAIAPGPFVSGTPWLTRLWLPAGISFTRISMWTGNTGVVTPTHQWFGVWDNNLKTLALTADDLATAWVGNVQKTLNVTGGAFQTTYAGWHYLGVLITAATMPLMVGDNLAAASSTANALTPIPAGASATTGLTTPASCPATLGALAVASAYNYMEINP